MMGLMDKFEKQFENLDVQSKVMDESMASTTAASTPESQVFFFFFFLTSIKIGEVKMRRGRGMEKPPKITSPTSLSLPPFSPPSLSNQYPKIKQKYSRFLCTNIFLLSDCFRWRPLWDK